MGISSFMSDDHHRCDELFASAEHLVDGAQWDQAKNAVTKFLEAMEEHFLMEEETLFPQFEAASGNAMGPTQVMRHEHQQMRQLFAQMQTALQNKDNNNFLGASETLLILMQQHNMKEEQILYPMTDRFLDPEQTIAGMKGKSTFYGG